MENRADSGLGFLLRYENIAWYADGAVKLLDRRVYPTRVEWVECSTVAEVAQCIADMVTQSAGPYTAAAMGMALAAYECKDLPNGERLEYMQSSAHILSNARPTTTDRMSRICTPCLEVAVQNIANWDRVPELIVQCSVEMNNSRYRKIEQMARYLVELLPQNAAVMTQCYAETIIGQLVKVAKEQSKRLKFFCCETRPYFQGARLTASLVNDMGVEATVITDNMAGYVMQNENVDILLSAADVICGDGHIVNKIGTMQLAILAKYFGIPYYVTGAPDAGHPTASDIKLEQRDPEYVLYAMGVRTAQEGIKGYYPAFDITPPHLVTAVIADTGVYVPTALLGYYKNGGRGEY